MRKVKYVALPLLWVTSTLVLSLFLEVNGIAPIAFQKKQENKKAVQIKSEKNQVNQTENTMKK